MNKVLNILLADGSARQVLPMAKSLKELGHKVTTYNSSKFDFGYASKYPHSKILSLIDWDDKKKTLESLIQHISSQHFDLIIPTNDNMAILLSENKKQVEKYTKVAVNEWKIFKVAMDKYQTMQICMKNNIPCPLTLMDLDEFNQYSDKLKFPVVVKPRTGCGAVGFYISSDYEDMKSYYEIASKQYGPCLIQEYIPQTDLQYKAELFVDSHGEIKSAVVFAKDRWYPVNGGSSTLNETVDRPDIVVSCSALLKVIGWRGYADIDLIQDPRDKTAKIIEINPRITGSVKICFKAGVNFSQQIVEDALGLPVTEMLSYQKGIFLRYFQKDILWLIKSPTRFSSSPSWFNFKNNSDQIFDIKDIMPFIVSSFEAIPNLYQDYKKRKLKA